METNSPRDNRMGGDGYASGEASPPPWTPPRDIQSCPHAWENSRGSGAEPPTLNGQNR